MWNAIGSVRRECLDAFDHLNELHLRRILGSYLDYYHGSRTHLSLGKDTPDGRPGSSRPGRNGRFLAARSAVCIIVTNASRPDHRLRSATGDQFLSVATRTLRASACPCIAFAGTAAKSGGISIVMTAPIVDYKIHWLKMMSVTESRAVVGRHDGINGRDSPREGTLRRRWYASERVRSTLRPGAGVSIVILSTPALIEAF